jgi:hypothetical protein
MVLGHNATHRHAEGVRALYGRLRDDAWQRDLDRLTSRD